MSPVSAIFRWLEGTVSSFPTEAPEKPPATFWGFVLHYARPFWPLIAGSSVLAVATALIEVSLFAFVGKIVDWLSHADRATFWSDHGLWLALMGGLVLIVLPALKFLYESSKNQGLLGNFAMRTRWQTHRYVLRQSMEFFQNDFAGRIAQKVLQTSLAVRDVVLKITEVLLYVGVYFTGALILFASSDWRLSAPLVAWFVCYLAALYYFVPRLARISRQQADARSVVTGRIVDSYTNIPTVKMFAHAEREDHYAREGMEGFLDTVYRSMRLATLLTFTLNTLNSILLFAVAGLSIWLWYVDAITTGAIAFSIGLVLRMQGMAHWIMWEISQLFENIGVVHDGIETIARERSVVDAPDAEELIVRHGEIRYEGIGFNYGKPGGHGERGVIDHLSLTVRAGEKVGLVGRSGAGKSTLVSLLLRFHDLEKGRILIDGADVARVSAEFAARQYRHGDAGHLAAQPLDPRQHPLWSARSDDGGGGRGGAPGARP